MIDTLPAWFWVPVAVVLWLWALHPYITRRFRPVSALVARGFAEWRECRAEFDLALDAAYERAAEATNDRLVTAEGRRAGIAPRSLFYGPQSRAHRYASPELLEWWESHPRLTFESFERQWMASA